MRKHFPSYYHLTDKEKQQLFKSKNCYFVFDTNALLDIYRLGKETAEKVLKLLEKLRRKIIIPKHVAREYHDNMLGIITEICSGYGTFLDDTSARAIMEQIMARFDIKNKPFIKHKMDKFIKPAIESFLNDVRCEKEYMLNQFRTWGLQNKLSDLLGGMLLAGFTDKELARMEKEGTARYAMGIPPGCEDKAKNSNKFGDFIIWKEILRFAKKKSCSIIFVSRDLKKDWLQVLNGMTCGPRQELLDEFTQYSPNGSFHIYTLDQFIRFANEEDNVLSENDISEVEEIVSTPVAEKSSMPAAKSVEPEKMGTPTDDKSSISKSANKVDEESTKSMRQQLKGGATAPL